MSGMIERVAKAMHEALPVEPWDKIPWEELPDSGKDEYRTRSRAAIEAMRGPTEAMIDAGGASVYGHPREKAIEWAKEDKFDGCVEEAREVFTAMIDAALKP